jgi:SAM-dependent methyltransferase
MNFWEWDDNAEKRYFQQINGQDITFSHIFIPFWTKKFRALTPSEKEKVMEIGCGTGVLTEKISDLVGKITALEPSLKMYEIANQHTASKKNITIINQPFQHFRCDSEFHICFAHMVLHNVDHLEQFFTTTYTFLRDRGILWFIIPHPCFFFVNKQKEFDRFSYLDRKSYKIAFTISLDPIPLPSQITYYHRPLSDYVNCALSAGFQLHEMIEIQPDENTLILYPEQPSFPRYLFFSFRKA